jgi:hypothetical protein
MLAHAPRRPARHPDLRADGEQRRAQPEFASTESAGYSREVTPSVQPEPPTTWYGSGCRSRHAAAQGAARTRVGTPTSALWVTPGQLLSSR